jgi:hypothetical protein
MTVTVEPLPRVPGTSELLLTERRDSPRPPTPDDRAGRPVGGARSLLAPAAIHCAPADEVAGVIDRVQEELGRMRQQLTETERDTAEVEARLAAEGIDPIAAIAVARAVPRFLADLREEAEDQAMALVLAAQAEARAMRRSADPRDALFEARLGHWRRLVARTPVTEPELSWRPQAPPAHDVSVLPAPSPMAPDTSGPVLEAEAGGVVESPVPETDHAESEDFWAGVDAADARRTRRWTVVTRVGALRAAAVACVAAAVAVHFA